MKTPLIHAASEAHPPNERPAVASQRLGFLPKYEPGSSAIDRYIEERRGKGRLWIWANQETLFEEMNVLDQAVHVFNRHVEEMQKAPFWKQLDLLFQLEESFMAMGGVQSEILRLWASDVDAVFEPCPSEQALTAFAAALAQVQNKKFGTSLLTVKQWAEYKRWPQKLSSLSNEQRDAIRSEESEFTKFVYKLILHVRTQYSQYPLITWLLGSFLGELSKERYAFLEVPVFSLIGDLAQHKDCLKWTTLGWTAGVLVSQEVIEPGALAPGPAKLAVWHSLTSMVMPRFGFQMTRLHGVLDSQMTWLTESKQQMLAVVATLGMTFGQVLLRKAMDVPEDELAE